jgi:hypothetical protein
MTLAPLLLAAVLASNASGKTMVRTSPGRVVAVPGGGNVDAILSLAGFPSTGLSFYGGNGVYHTTFDPDAYLDAWNVTTTLYANLATGNDTTGTGGSAAPFKTVHKAIKAAYAAPDTATKIVVQTNGADVLFQRDGGGADNQFYPGYITTVSNKKLAIVPDDSTKRLHVASSQTGLSWSLTAAQTYTFQATRSSVATILDMSQKDAYGLPLQYVLKTSIATVEATPGSWWQSGSTVYVHTIAGTVPVDGTHLTVVQLLQFAVDIGSGGELFLRNAYFLGSNGVSASIRNVTNDYTATKFVCWSCAFANANPTYIGGAGSNGLAVESVKAVQIYNSVAAYNSADGFNFHYTRADPGAGAHRDYYALVFGSVAYSNGIGNAVAPNINNGFTSHEGAHFAMVGSSARDNQGPNVATVNACNSVVIGGSSTASAHTTPGQAAHAALYFDNATPPAGLTGAAYLYDTFASDTTWDLSTDGTNLPITLRKFRGTKINPAALPYVH